MTRLMIKVCYLILSYLYKICSFTVRTNDDTSTEKPLEDKIEKNDANDSKLNDKSKDGESKESDGVSEERKDRPKTEKEIEEEKKRVCRLHYLYIMVL